MWVVFDLIGVSASTSREFIVCGHLRNFCTRDRVFPKKRVGDRDRDLHRVGGSAEGFRELVAQFVRFRQFVGHCD
jgi:hypothetical protein